MSLPGESNTPTNKPTTEPEGLFEQFRQHGELVKAQNSAKQKNAIQQIEKMTKFRLFLILLYTISLLVFLNLIIDFSRQIRVNTALDQVYLNQILTRDGYITPDQTKVPFRSVTDANTMIRYIHTLIYGIYQDDLGNLILDDFTTFVPSGVIHYEVISPLRLLQKRSQVIFQPENKYFPTRLNLDESLENTTDYGTESMRFKYSVEEGGFKLNLMINSFNITDGMLNAAIENGFLDFQTKEVQVDLGQYNSNNNYVIYLKLNFFFHRTGAVTRRSETVSFRKDFYGGDIGTPLLAFQIIFAILFVYFFLQELVKIYSQIRKEMPNQKNYDDNKNALAQVTAGAANFKQKLLSILKGLLCHLKNPWSFLDVMSLICSLADILIWFKLITDNTPERILSITSTTSKLSVREMYVALDTANHELEQVTYDLILFRHIAAVNVMILIIKMLRYLTGLNEQTKLQVQILVTITARLVPFIILIISIMFAYVLAAYFYYGDSVAELYGVFWSFKYFLANFQGSYDQVDAMLKVNKNVTIVFYIAFIFIAIFILLNMFLVYAIHTYKEFMDAKEKEKQIKMQGMDGLEISPNIFWSLKNFFSELGLFFLRILRPQKYRTKRSLLKDKEMKERKELALDPSNKFDESIPPKSYDLDNPNPIFVTEEVIVKLERNRKIISVKRIWKTMGIILGFLLLIIVTTEHHKVSNAQAMYTSINELFEREDLRVILRNGTMRSFNSPKSVRYLQNFAEVSNWLINMFSNYVMADSRNFTNGRSVSGNFIAGDNLLLTNTLRLTIRKRSHIPLTEDMYHGVNKEMLTPLFEATSVNPDGELKSPITGQNSGKVYNYTENGGYHKTGGYVVESSMEDFQEMVSEINKEGNVIDSDCSSVVLDFMLYQVSAENALNVNIIFQMNAGSALDISINLDFVGLNYYNSLSQIFVAIIEVLALCWAITNIYRIYRRIRRRNYQYNLWYSLYIANLPETMKRLREKKKPEIFRRLHYLLDSKFFINLFPVSLVIASAVTWIMFITYSFRAKNIIRDYLSQTNSANSNTDLLDELEKDFKFLFVLRILESLVFIALSFKVIHYYSYFRKFQFLTQTLKKSAIWLLELFVVLLFLLFAFGLFMQLIRGSSDDNYKDIWGMLAKQLEIFKTIRTKDKATLTGNYETFISSVYYMPWVLIATCIMYNMFIGAVFTAYQSMTEKGKNEESLEFMEFFRITAYILKNRKKTSTQQQKVHYEVKEQIRAKFNLKKVFDQYGNFVELPTKAKSFQKPEVWVNTCAKNLVLESESRKGMKGISREIEKMSVVDYDFDKQEHKKILTDQEKHSQFVMKLKYWKYFAHGQKKTLEYMDILDQGIEYNKKILGDIKTRKINRKVDNRIRKYIIQLEEQIAKDISDIQIMKKKLDEYQDEKVH